MASSAEESSASWQSRGRVREAGGAVENDVWKFYSVYSVFRPVEAILDFSMVCICQNVSPWPHLFFVFK